MVIDRNELQNFADAFFTEQLRQAGYDTALFGKLHVSSHSYENERRHPRDGEPLEVARPGLAARGGAGCEETISPMNSPVVMLVISFALLLAINGLQAWQRRRSGAQA